MKTKTVSFCLSSMCLALVWGFPLTSQAAKTHLTEVARIAAPPEGKALVNIFHTGIPGPMGANVRVPIFDETGKFLIDLPDGAECQLILDPGTKSLIAWWMGNPINVLTADLAPNKTYDLVFDKGLLADSVFVPLSKASRSLRNLDKLEHKLTHRIVTLDRDQVALDFEASQKDHIEKIKADFLGGPKSKRVIHVGKDDCR
jgi:hypothetical protein